MKNISIGLITLFIMLLSGCTFNNSETEYSDGSNNPLEINVPKGYQAHYGDFDYAFLYPDNYLVDSLAGNKNDAFLESLFLFDESYLDWDAPEGHPGINVYVFAMSEGKELSEIANAQNTYTNYSMATNFRNESTKNGYDYISYSIDGLYQFDYYLFEYGGYLYVFAGYDNSTEATERKKVKDIVDSLIFNGKELDEKNNTASIDGWIEVTEPLIGESVDCPLHVSGRARGPWFFEASFSAELVGENAEIIATSKVQAMDNWMTEEYVPFQFDLYYETDLDSATLILRKSNTSGLVKNELFLEIPLNIESCNSEDFTVYQRELVEDYIKLNIGSLSPVEPVLGGTWQVLDIEFLEDNNVLVTYEDGHVQEEFEAQFTLSEQVKISIKK